MDEEFYPDEHVGDRLLISRSADESELEDNIRAARSIISSFPDVLIRINSHRLEFHHKNPEYTIDELLGDRKGIEGEPGVTNAFQKALKQQCEIIVLDLDCRLKRVKPFELSKYINRRKNNFKHGQIKRCYVVFGNRAVVITDKNCNRQSIEDIIKQLEPRIIEAPKG